MSEAMKKRRTENVIVSIGEKNPKRFALPKNEAQGLIQMLRQYEIKESSSWRDSFKDLLKQSGEGGLALRAERELLQLTQVEVAEKIGVPQHVISEMENGKRPIGKKMAERLAFVFKTDYRVFL